MASQHRGGLVIPSVGQLNGVESSKDLKQGPRVTEYRQTSRFKKKEELQEKETAGCLASSYPLSWSIWDVD